MNTKEKELRKKLDDAYRELIKTEENYYITAGVLAEYTKATKQRKGV